MYFYTPCKTARNGRTFIMGAEEAQPGAGQRNKEKCRKELKEGEAPSQLHHLHDTKNINWHQTAISGPSQMNDISKPQRWMHGSAVAESRACWGGR